MTHQELCNRALRWLRGTRYCEPVFSRIASCNEIPDGIGWSSRWKFRGSTVIECKTSRSDFYADKKKRVRWIEPKYNYPVRLGISAEGALQRGYTRTEVPRMGDYRFYFSEPEIVTLELIEKHAPDHGLLYVDGRRVKVIKDAPRREKVDYVAEIRYLRFAIINGKTPHEPVSMPATRFEDLKASSANGGMKLF